MKKKDVFSMILGSFVKLQSRLFWFSYSESLILIFISVNENVFSILVFIFFSLVFTYYDNVGHLTLKPYQM